MSPFWLLVPLSLGIFAVFGIFGWVCANHVPASMFYFLDAVVPIVVFAAGCLVLHHEYRPSFTQLGLLPDVFRSPKVRRWIYLAIGVAVVLRIIALLFAHLRGATTSSGFLSPVQEAWEHLPTYVIVSVALGPLMEEFAFRGYIYLLLRQNWGDTVAALVASAIFATAHLGHLPFYFWLSLLWIYFNNRAGSLWPSIAAHIVFNAGLLIFPPFPGK
jgi:hypothetical protein